MDKGGATQSYVFRGSIRVQVVSSDRRAAGESRVLHENESARVDRSGMDARTVVATSGRSPQFVREMPKQQIRKLDLVDVVAGGDGFSGLRNVGIDPRNGERVRVWPTVPQPRFKSDGKYYRVQGMPFVDGVFIPYAASGTRPPVQLDSAGHSFAWFPDTDGYTFGPVWAGANGAITSTKLAGIDYNSPGHTLLDLHANKGITFDLDAIRKANPGWRIQRFSAVSGNTWQGPSNGNSVFADLWVFVDGQTRFQRRQTNQYSGAMPAVVPLGDKDRFLTLVATDGGDSYGFDHTMFGDPQLELVSTKANAGPTPPKKAADH